LVPSFDAGSQIAKEARETNKPSPFASAPLAQTNGTDRWIIAIGLARKDKPVELGSGKTGPIATRAWAR